MDALAEEADYQLKSLAEAYRWIAEDYNDHIPPHS